MQSKQEGAAGMWEVAEGAQGAQNEFRVHRMGSGFIEGAQGACEYRSHPGEVMTAEPHPPRGH